MLSKSDRTLALAVLCVGLAVLAVHGQTTGPKTPPLAIESMYGPDLYRMYCATCHGLDAKGGGPAAKSLRVSPPDLTVLARRQHGVFQTVAVESIIRGGTEIASHGSEEMPVWGPIFLALDPSDARVKMRIANLASYLASIQQK